MEMLNQISWLVPLTLSFILGIGIGVIAKYVLKIAIGIIVLLAFASWVGYTQFPNVKEAINLAMEQAPLLLKYMHILPLSSATFVIGFGIGFWKG